MTTETIQFDISDGPSADRVIDALKYVHTPGCTISVEFTLRRRSDARIRGALSGSGHKVTAQIVGVTYESGLPGMFLLTMHIPGFNTSKGFYDANARTGVFNLKPAIR